MLLRTLNLDTTDDGSLPEVIESVNRDSGRGVGGRGSECSEFPKTLAAAGWNLTESRRMAYRVWLMAGGRPLVMRQAGGATAAVSTPRKDCDIGLREVARLLEDRLAAPSRGDAPPTSMTYLITAYGVSRMAYGRRSAFGDATGQSRHCRCVHLHGGPAVMHAAWKRSSISRSATSLTVTH